MLSDLILGAYTLFINDSRFKDDIGTNTLINFFSKTVEDEPTCTPFITFNVDSITTIGYISLGKKELKVTPLKILCGVTNFEDVWDTLVDLDAVIKNIELTLNENPKLGGVAYDSSIIQEVYGFIYDNEGNPFYKVCEITLQVKEIMTTNVC